MCVCVCVCVAERVTGVECRAECEVREAPL